MNTFRIALYPGDGIGPEVVDAAIEVVEAASRAVGGFELRYERFDWGMNYYDRHGQVVPDDFLTTLRGFDAIFWGARLAGAGAGWRGARAADPVAAGVRSLCEYPAGPDLPRRARPAAQTNGRSTSSSCARTPKANMSITAERLRRARPARWPFNRPSTAAAASSGSCDSPSNLPARGASDWP